jgi:hypothetical protein
MPQSLAAARSTRPQLLADDLSIDALPPDRLALIKNLAVPEDWGDKDDVLLRYLAVHVPLAIEQGRYVWDGKRLVMRAGHLATAEGAGVYIGLARAGADGWALDWAGERPAKVEALLPPELGAWPELDTCLEVVVAIDQFRAPELAGLTLVAQSATVAGAVEWSLRRGLAVRHLRSESRGYFLPVHLTSRTGAPELVAPIQVQAGRLVVRALIEPRAAYASARAVVERRDELSAWVLEAWEMATEVDGS